MKFDLPEYKEAFDEFTDAVVKRAIRTGSFLGLMNSERSIHAGPVRHVPGDDPLDNPMTHVEHEMTLHSDVIRNSDVDAFGEEFLKTPASVIDQLEGAFVRQFESIVDRTGNARDAGGHSFDFDQYLIFLESWDMKFDADGNPDLGNLLILAGPGTAIEPPEPETEDQERRLEELIERKRVEHNAKKRSRRLS